MVSSSVTQRQYSPATARATPSHRARGTFFPRAKPARGTRTMYSAVMNPALPGVVVSRPFCWKKLATDSAAPQQRPPRIKSRRDPAGARSSPFRRRQRVRRPHRPSRKKKAMTARAVLKVKGPIYSAPTLWATKAVPQIMAVTRGRTF